MTIDDICKLPVGSIAADNCALFLWVTFPHLPLIPCIVGAWGFTYKTVAFVWVKKNKLKDTLKIGMGRWTRANAEICILATRGKPRRISKAVSQLIVSKISCHSRKPVEVHDRISQLLGDDISKVELFATQRWPGWVSWGYDVTDLFGDLFPDRFYCIDGRR